MRFFAIFCRSAGMIGHRRRRDGRLVSEEGNRMSLNKTELISAIASKSGLTKADADKAIDAFQEVLIESLGKGEAVKVTGLFSAERVERAARTGRNPRTGEEIQIPANFGVKISAGSLLKKAVAK
jgi:DNA-binding protein HU-beta